MVCLPTFSTKKATINVGKYAVYMGWYGGIFLLETFFFFFDSDFSPRTRNRRLQPDPQKWWKWWSWWVPWENEEGLDVNFPFRGKVEHLGFVPSGWHSKNRDIYPKMDGENHGKPYFLMDDLGGKTHYFRKHPLCAIVNPYWTTIWENIVFTFSRHRTCRSKSTWADFPVLC